MLKIILSNKKCFLCNYFCFLLSFFPFFVFSQSTAIIGTGTTTNAQYFYPAPYGNYYWGAKHQILVRASEMTSSGMAAGNITALAFQVSIPGGSALTGFTIRMKATSSTTITTSFDNSGFITVYGPQNFTDAAGWNTHALSTPFVWDGTSNILIETCFNNTSMMQNARMYYTSTAYSSVCYLNQNINSICSQASGITSTNRPNIKFSYVPNGPPTSQFIGKPTTTCSGTVAFTDQSFYTITNWLWDFGDGTTSTTQHPIHTYTTNGTYSVSLQTTNAYGNNTLIKPNYIQVSIGSGPISASCSPQTTAYCCGFGITNFSFQNLNNTSADASEGYMDYSCVMDTATTGQTYTISVSTPTPSAHNVRAWLDFNNDGTFNPTGELIFSADNSLLATGTVFIPGNVTLNTPLRLRVSADHNLNSVPTPCSNLQYGQAEDYAIYVKPNLNPPVANFSANDTASCSGIVQFTDQSQNIPTSWQWNFGDGTISTSQSPVHTYTANGTYSVSLTTANTNGSNTLVKNNYITVALGNAPVAASCTPSTFSYCCGYGIYNVQLNSINKTSADGSEGYKDFSCADQTTLTEGQSYTVSIQTSVANTQDTKVWIDFNNDGAFTQTNELLFTKLNTINPTGNISIPAGVAVLNTVLRMRISSDNAGSNLNSCSALIRGQAEDYGVKIQQSSGIQDINTEQANVIISPNPFTTEALFEIKDLGIRIKDLEIQVYDVFGKMVLKSQQLSQPFLISRGILGTGMYFYFLQTGNEFIASGKFIIE